MFAKKRRRRSPDEVVSILIETQSWSDEAILARYEIAPTTLWRWRAQYVDIIGETTERRPRGVPTNIEWSEPDVQTVSVLRQLREPQPTRRTRKAELRHQNEKLRRIVADQMSELLRLRPPVDGESVHA